MNILLGAIVGGIIGGIIGLIFALLQKLFKFKSKKVVQISTIAAVVVMVPFMQNKELQYHVAKYIFPGQAKLMRMEQMIVDNLPDKEYRHYLKKLNQAQIQMAVAKGLKRLKTDELYSWNNVRIQMAKSSEELCAGFWTGMITADMVVKSLKQLSEEEMKVFAKASAMAFVYEKENRVYVSSSQEDAKENFEILAKKMDQNLALKFNDSLMKGANIPSDQACWTILQIMEYADNNRTDKSEKLLRFIAQNMAPK